MSEIISLKGIKKSYFIGEPNELEVLHGIDLNVNEGEFVSIVGESGSGKSTLMNIIGALDRQTEGQYILDDIDVSAADDKELSSIRNKKIGFVFQTFNLIGSNLHLKMWNFLCFMQVFLKKSAEKERKCCLIRLV